LPFYRYACPNGHTFELFLTLVDHVSNWACRGCTERAQQVITAPLMVKVAQDVCYDSPIDGRAITSWDARQEDLKRSNCVPYDPEQKTDAANRRKQEEAALDTLIETHAEQVTEKMTTAQRGKIYSELTEQGKTAEIVRTSL